MTEDEINELHQKRILKNQTVHKILDTVLDKIPLAQGTVPNSYLLGTCPSSDQGSEDHRAVRDFKMIDPCPGRD